jgi:hypothetical protein
MANKTITQLTDAGALTGAEEVPVYRTDAVGDKTLKTTAQAIANLATTGSRQFHTFQMYEDATHLSGQGSSQLLSSLGYTNQTAAAQFPKCATAWGSITASAVTYDTCVIQEAIYTLGYEQYTKVESEYNRLYVVNRQIVIPSVKVDVDVTDRSNSQQYLIDFCGTRINDIRTGAGSAPLFIKEPPTETRAANHDLENSWTISNANLYAVANGSVPYSGSVAFKLGAGKRVNIIGCTFHNFDIPVVTSLILNGMIERCEFINCLSSGFKSTQGWWTGASANTSPSQLTFLNNRFKDAGSKYLWLENADTTSLIGNNQFEGNGGDYAIYWNNLSGSVIKNFTASNLRIEQESVFARAIVGVRAGDGFSVTVNKVFHQAASAGTVLVEAESTGGENRIEVTNCYNSGGNASWKLRNIVNGGANDWEISKTILNGQPTTEAQLISGVAPYDNIWALDYGGSIPTSNRVNFTQRLPKG